MIHWAKKFVPKNLGKKLTSFLLVFSLLVSFLNSIPRDVFAQSDDLTTLTTQLASKADEIKSANGSAKTKKIDDFKTIAKSRRDKLKQLILDKPSEVGKYLIQNKVDFPQEVQGEIESREDHKGVLRAVHIDYSGRPSTTEYYLYGSTDLAAGAQFAVSADVVSVNPTQINTPVTISGYAVDNQLWYSAVDNTQLAGSASVSPPVSALVSGDRKVGYYYVTFKDNRTRGIFDSTLDSFVNNKFKNFISDSSSGRLNLVNTIHNLDLDVNKTCALMGFLGIGDGPLINAVYDKAMSLGINPYDDVDRIIILDSSVSCGGKTGMSQIGPGWAYSVGTGAIAHEFGHNMRLDHAGTWDCADAVVESDCVPDEYGNFTDVMGNWNVLDDNDFGGYAKQYLGWLGAGELIDLDTNSSGGTFTLSKLEDRGNGSPRVLRIKTFNGGPAYYIQYRKKGNTGSLKGPTVELASGQVSDMKRTLLLDTTPGSQFGPADFGDGYINDGQEFNDPFNGIIVKSISRDSSSVTLQVSFYPGSGSGSINPTWSRPDGFVQAAGQRKVVNWNGALYEMSWRCTSGYACDPTKWTDQPATTDHNGSFLIGSSNLGYAYEYKVILLTKDDNDPSKLNFYPWVDPTAVSNDCGGAATCTIPIFWPVTNYRVTLYQESDGQPTCVTRLMPGVNIGCSDAIMISDSTTLTFRGLPADISMVGKVQVNDNGGGLHLLQDLGSLGVSDTYIKSCSGGNGCSMSALTFQGYEPLLTSIRMNDPNGTIIRGPEFNLAFADGSFGYSNWSWSYYVEAFPNNLGSCAAAGGQCQKSWINDTQSGSFSRVFDGLVPGADYRVRVCIVDCSSANGNSVWQDKIYPSSFDGPRFFAYDPFDIALNNNFTGEYFDNSDFTNKKLTRTDQTIKFNWGSGSADPLISPSSYSVRWNGFFGFGPTTYRFSAQSDAKTQVYVDGIKIIDAKGLGLNALEMTQGVHTIRVDYAHSTGTSNVRARFVPAYSCFDINGDGVVNSLDLGLMAANYNLRGISAYDLNGDKVVNSIDLGILSKNYNQHC